MRSLATRPRRRPAHDGLVERAEPAELCPFDQILEQCRPRRSVRAQRLERVRPRLGVGRAAQDQPKRPLHELLVADPIQVELRRKPVVHPPILGDVCA